MLNERMIITVMIGLLTIATYIFIQKQTFPHRSTLALTTLLFPGLLLLYYHLFVYDPSHGMGIIILPLATFWLSWRREHTGKPAVSTSAFILMQFLFVVLYILMVHFQEG